MARFWVRRSSILLNVSFSPCGCLLGSVRRVGGLATGRTAPAQESHRFLLGRRHHGLRTPRPSDCQGSFLVLSGTGFVEDGVQERPPGLGFNAPCVATTYALGDEDTAPEPSGENQVDFATRAPTLPTSPPGSPYAPLHSMKSAAKTTPTSPPSRAKSARSPSKPWPPATIFLNIPTGAPPDHRLPPNQP